MIRVEFTRHFSAAHRLADDLSKCRRIHGHNYKAEIMVVVDSALDPSISMLVPADLIKAVVDEKYDHRLILEHDDPLRLALDGERIEEPHVRDWVVLLPYSPTTENLATQIAMDVRDTVLIFLKERRQVLILGEVHVTLQETETISAHVRIGFKDLSR